MDDTEEVFKEMLRKFGDLSFECGTYDMIIDPDQSHHNPDGYASLNEETNKLHEQILDLVYEYMPKQYRRRKK